MKNTQLIMRRQCKWSLLTLLFCFLSFFITAQSVLDAKISGSYQGQTAEAILEQIEAQHPIRFFFQGGELPEQKHTGTFTEAKLSEVLDFLLQNSLFGYFEYRERSIIIMPRLMINEAYSSNYYKALEASLNTDETAQEKRRQIIVGDISQLRPSGKAVVKGRLVDENDNEPIIGATIFFPDLEIGLASDAEGGFEVEIPTGAYEMNVQYVGYQEIVEVVQVFSDGEINLKMATDAVQLQEVVVEAQGPDANVQNAQIGVERLDVGEIKKLPAFLGEVDVVNTLLLYPGVSTIGEGATGFNVRGGDVDQNLILQDEGFIFNSSHALGFFSTFNADLISEVELYKGNIPAQYGGRLTSVLDVKMRDGDFNNFHLKGGVGPISSRISLEGPIIEGKSSFLGGFRSSYSDWILNLIRVPEVQRSSSFFYDANLRFTTRINEKNSIILSGYSSEDDFVYNNEFGFDYQTLMGQLIYKKIFNDQFFSNLSFTGSQYKSAQTAFGGLDAARVENELTYYRLKEHLTLTPNNDLQLDAGLAATYYLADPGNQSPANSESQIPERALEREKGLEAGVFVNADWSITPAFQVSAGLRFNLYQFLGPKTIYLYENDEPSLANILGTQIYGGGESIASYGSLEPRFSMRYRLNAETSIKAGYSRTAQFINQIFNTDSPTPTSQWQLSTKYIKPTRSHNFSAGIFRNFDNNLWETSAEIYYRIVDQLFDYKDFADLNINDHLETELLAGEGRAYGLELSIKKKEGIFNGWLSYTLARTERLIEGINKGDWYPSNFDKPHDLSLVLNWQPNQRNTLTLNFNYGRGRPTTAPIGNFRDISGLTIPIYSQRNQLRIPDYHRIDIAYTLGKGYNRTKKFKTSWTISIYNVYGRRNAFSVFFTQGAFQLPVSNKLSILGSAFPSVTFNFEVL